MKYHVIYDQNGKIVSVAQAHPSDSKVATGLGPGTGPGQLVGEVEVAAEHTKLDLTSLAEQLHVDVKAGRVEHRPKKS